MAKKNRLPKRIAGFKVPRFMRKSKLLRSVLSTPTGRDLAAQALTAAAGAAAAVLIRDREQVIATGKKGAKKGVEAVGIAAEAVESAAGAAMDVVSDTAKALLPDADTERSRRNQEKEARRH